MQNYDNLEAAGNSMGEDNDCAVIAVALVTGLAYQDVHDAFKKNGRKNCKPAYFEITIKTLSDLGYALVDITEEIRAIAKTPRTLGRVNRKGRYLVITSGHIFAWIDGEVEDWTKGRLHRIINVYHVVMKD